MVTGGTPCPCVCRISLYHKATLRAEVRATEFFTALKYPEEFFTMLHAHSSGAVGGVEVRLNAVLAAIASCYDEKGGILFPGLLTTFAFRRVNRGHQRKSTAGDHVLTKIVWIAIRFLWWQPQETEGRIR